MGDGALLNNINAASNTAVGVSALRNNTIGIKNTAGGHDALLQNNNDFNTAVGYQALHNNTTGTANTAIGAAAGFSITGSGNICIGQGVASIAAAGVNDTTWIGNIYSSVADGRAVYVNIDNKLGTLSSSRRYKDEIRPMKKASEAILSLAPVSFRYKKEVDPTRSLSFGLIAEEVAQVDPDLVTLDRDGKPETVRYEAVNAMLLNEFLKEHRIMQELQSNAARQEAIIAQLKQDFQSKLAEQQRQIKALTSGLEKVNNRLDLNKPASQVVVNDR